MSELPWLHSLVKHNVAAKHGSSKPLTSNKLWLLELRIKSTCILAPIPDALWDMCKLSIVYSVYHLLQYVCDFKHAMKSFSVLDKYVCYMDALCKHSFPACVVGKNPNPPQLELHGWTMLLHRVV